MTTTPAPLPHGFWQNELPTLRRIAPTMTADQLAAHYNTTRKRVMNSLSALGVDYLGKRPSPLNAKQDKEFRKLAPTHTAKQLAEHFGLKPKTIRSYAGNNCIELLKERCYMWLTRREELTRIAPSMTLDQLQAHYAAQGSRHTKESICQALKKLQISYKHGPNGPKPNAKPAVRKAKPMPKATTPKLTAPAPIMQACPPRTSIATKSKEPPEIIWPEHVKVQHIPTATPPAHAPICPSTMRQPYRAGQGMVGYQSL